MSNHEGSPQKDGAQTNLHTIRRLILSLSYIEIQWYISVMKDNNNHLFTYKNVCEKKRPREGNSGCVGVDLVVQKFRSARLTCSHEFGWNVGWQSHY